MIAPITDEDGVDRGWPETYVEQVAAQRRGRQASLSIYGFPPPAAPASRVADVVVEVAGKHAFVQLLAVGAGRVGLISLLARTITREAPYLDGAERQASLLIVDGDDLMAFIRAAAGVLEVDLYDIAWVHLGDVYASEVVVISTPEPVTHRRLGFDWHDPADRVKQERVPWDVLHAKLGMPVPILSEFTTLGAVESWHRAGRTQIEIRTDYSEHYNMATAAALLSHLASRDTPSDRQEIKALRLAVTRFDRVIDWDRSGVPHIFFLQQAHPNDVKPLLTALYPDFEHLRAALGAAATTASRPTTNDRQMAAEVLARLAFTTYGPFGDYPNPALADALDRAVRVLVDPTPDEPRSWMDAPIFVPVMHEVRQIDVAQRHSSWVEYATSLTLAADPDTPTARSLMAYEAHSREKRVGAATVMTDRDHNVVLSQDHEGYDSNRYTRYTIAVPVERVATRHFEALGNFEEIVIEPNTQKGVVLLSLDGALHVMPFAEPHPGGFTHGYNGSGPSNLIAAIQRFLEVQTGTAMTQEGARRLRGIIMGADQDLPLQITRGQILSPGMFEPSPHALPATDCSAE